MTSGIRYPEEFKREAVQLVRQGRTLREVADSLGCSIYAIRTWVQKADVESGAAEPPPSSRERDEIRALKRELLLVRQERDLLKKACAVFARDDRSNLL
jgi:transposase